MKVLAICIKTYIAEDDLQEFLDGERKSLNEENIFREGKEYLVIEKYYDKKYFRLVENAS
jgi:hypothetical protein